MSGRIIICGYKGIGKTTIANSNKRLIVDHDPESYKTKFDNPKKKSKVEWFKKYVDDGLRKSKNKILFLSDDLDVRNYLDASGIPFFFVLPDKKEKQKWAEDIALRIISTKSKKQRLKLCDELVGHTLVFDRTHRQLALDHKKGLMISETVVTITDQKSFFDYMTSSLKDR